eukprot:GEMP01100103.1.p1 GENE.GEMP01100103.1~~GEMP01100103.1.p1  ORF type:complete len:227 (+),score=27.16 GEMP01100103.1:45-725(+)
MGTPAEQATVTAKNDTPSADKLAEKLDTTTPAKNDTPDVTIKAAYMVKKERQFIRNTVRIIYSKVCADVKTPAIKKHAEFVTYLKRILDKRFGSHYHVICGEQLGYAAKCKPISLCKLQVNKTLCVIIYKSPSREELPQKEKQDDEWLLPDKEGLRNVEVIHCPSLGSPGEKKGICGVFLGTLISLLPVQNCTVRFFCHCPPIVFFLGLSILLVLEQGDHTIHNFC